jgi:hypothetical protein
VITLTAQLPACTPGSKASELIEVVHSYASQAPSDWVSIYAGQFYFDPDHAVRGRDRSKPVQYLLSVHRRLMDEHIDAARYKLYLFIHVYMLSSGIEPVQPRQEVRAVMLELPVAPPSAAW